MALEADHNSENYTCRWECLHLMQTLAREGRSNHLCTGKTRQLLYTCFAGGRAGLPLLRSYYEHTDCITYTTPNGTQN